MCTCIQWNPGPLKGHPSTKDIYAIKDTYQSPKHWDTAYFLPLMRGHLSVKDKKYCPIGVRLIGVPLYYTMYQLSYVLTLHVAVIVC